MTTLDQLQCLQAVAETGSLHAAAQQLHRAKSAVSYSIKNLEDQLDFALIDRSGYRLKVTPKGEAFLLKANKLLQEAQTLDSFAQQIANDVEVRIRISATALFPIEQISQAIKKTIQKFPSTEIIFHREILSGERMLMDEIVDVAIYEAIRNTRDIESKPIAKANLPLVISGKHPVVSLPKRKRSFESLNKYPQIILRSTIQDDTFQAGIQKDAIKWSVSDIATKKELIKEGLGWGRVPEHEVERELRSGKLIHLKELDVEAPITVHICRRRNEPQGQVMDFFWGLF